jgi:glycosyltransferase involved in cell wall biosynthesis
MKGWTEVSVVIITKNAAGVLGGALKSIPDEAEVVVADGASRDATVAVAREFGARVVPQNLQAVRAAGGNFDVVRNSAANRTRGSWILFLDADERLTPDLTAEIARRLADDGNQPAAFDIPRFNYFWGHPVRLLGADRQIRLVKRGYGRFEGCRLHQPMVVEGRLGHLSHPLVHYNIRHWRDLVRRWRLYIPLEAQFRSPAHVLEDLVLEPARLLRYYLIKQGAWRDGAIGVGVSLLYACYHAVCNWYARRNRRAGYQHHRY